jgi:hypothetical protein
MGDYIINVLVAIDRAVNAMLGGLEDQTISARAAFARRAGKPWGCYLCRLLDKLEPGHCDHAILRDQQDADSLPKQ